MLEKNQDSYFGKPWLVNVIVIVLFVLGFGIRMVDLTDVPLDFHPTRQFLSAIKARGMYYQYANDVPEWKREMAVQQWQDADVFEPAVNETVVAGLYLLFGEHLWLARIASSVYWLLGGLALFALSRRIASVDGAILGLAFYLFLGFGVIASRSFQPDPLMVGLILAGLWSFERWHTERTWKWTIITGLLSGLAIFVKTVAVFPLLGAFALVLLTTRGLKQCVKDPQVWALAIITILPTALFMIDSIFISKNSNLSADLRFFPSFWIDPTFYVRWKNMIGNTLGFGAFLLALLGIFLAKPGRDRSLLLGLLAGYIAYGLMFSYHIITHNYYQLPLFVFIPLSLSVVGNAIFQKLKEINNGSVFVRLSVAGILLFAMAFEMWNVRVELVRDDDRAEPQFWAELGEKLGRTSAVIGLTQDYGNRLAYWGWKITDQWPTTGDQNLRELAGKAKTFDEIFVDRVEGKDYFVVTNFNQFNNQPELKDKLFDTYSILEENPEYIIFDLQHPLEQP
ncbi:MAG: glycosyltransferase family 39 protein [Anaerolineales bacterium]